MRRASDILKAGLREEFADVYRRVYGGSRSKSEMLAVLFIRTPFERAIPQRWEAGKPDKTVMLCIVMGCSNVVRRRQMCRQCAREYPEYRKVGNA